MIYKIYGFVISLVFVDIELIINDLDLDKPLQNENCLWKWEQNYYKLENGFRNTINSYQNRIFEKT